MLHNSKHPLFQLSRGVLLPSKWQNELLKCLSQHLICSVGNKIWVNEICRWFHSVFIYFTQHPNFFSIGAVYYIHIYQYKTYCMFFFSLIQLESLKRKRTGWEIVDVGSWLEYCYLSFSLSLSCLQEYRNATVGTTATSMGFLHEPTCQFFHPITCITCG